MPQNQDEWKIIANDFEITWNYPNCIGAVDGKHIVIQSPVKSGSLFFNYKGSFSIVLMGIADANYCFLYANIGCQGRISDGGVFRQTSFYQKLQKNELSLPTGQPLPRSDVLSPYVLVADDAFPLQLHIMKPYSGHQEKGSIKRIYNYRQARARRVIENTFGLLASVFRVFRKPLMLNVKNAVTVTSACIYLHNFLRKSTRSRPLYAPYGTLDIDTQDGSVISGSWRAVVQDDTGMVNLQRKPRKSNEEAKAVRDEFAKYFMSQEGKISWQDNY
ncbi:hypothetical protein J6590_108498 [Homalodisca vitripennis]|nr:hypothetical protein J6590_108498 [Homalodisca vitripennis]